MSLKNIQELEKVVNSELIFFSKSIKLIILPV